MVRQKEDIKLEVGPTKEVKQELEYQLEDICKQIKAEKSVNLELINQLKVALKNNDNSDHIKYLVDIHILTSLLSSYEALRTPKDVKIYDVISKLEKKHGIDFGPLQPFVWGPSAVEHYHKLTTLGSTLHRISPNQIITIFDSSVMWNTVKNHSKPENKSVYDERFVMRLFASLMYAGSELSCKPFIESNCLALIFSCTSSKNTSTRTLAYYNLQKFLSLLLELKEEKFEEKALYIYILRLFKQSITTEAPRISHLISHFFARVSKLTLHPKSPAYSQILSFLCQKPQVDLNNVPEFYKLLLSTSSEHYKNEREWMLQLLSEAIIDPIDYNVLQNRSGIKILLCFFISCLCDQPCRKLILATLKAACTIPSAAYDLFHRCNLHSWISIAIRASFLSFSQTDLQNPNLTRWERNYLAQIFVILLENEKLVRSERSDVEDRVAAVSAKLAAKSVMSVLEETDMTEAVSAQHIQSLNKFFGL